MADTVSIVQKVTKGGQMRIIAALAVVALVGASLGFIMLRGGADESLLYSGLDLTESAKITGRLDKRNIRYSLREDGASIYVDRDKVHIVRNMLSEEDPPERESLGSEIFDKTDCPQFFCKK